MSLITLPEKCEYFNLVNYTMNTMSVDEARRVLEYLEFNGRIAVAVSWNYQKNKYNYKLVRAIEYLKTIDSSYPICNLECIFSGGRPDNPRRPYAGNLANLLTDRIMCRVDEEGILFLMELDNNCFIRISE